MNVKSIARLKWFWPSCAVILLLTSLVTAFIGGIHFNAGERTVRLACEPVQPGEDKVFFHVQWDGPTGEFISGDNYGVRLWKWCLRLDILNDPIGAAKRRLPGSPLQQR